MSNTKVCTGCHEELPTSAYTVRRSARNGKMYPMARCKKCRSAEMKRRYADPERRREIREQQSRYYYRSKDSRKRRDYELRRCWGITLLEYEAMLAAQNGGCAICGHIPKEGEQRLAVDHCHIKNKIRGLLCGRCNLGIGYFGDDPEKLRAAAEYCANIRAMAS